MLKTKIKASSINNLTDARYFAAWGVEWLGFNFDEGTENYLSLSDAKAISEWVDGVQLVGEFSYHELDAIKTAVELLQLDAVQLGPFTPEHYLEALQEEISVIQEIIIEPTHTASILLGQLKEAAPYVEHFLLDFAKNKIGWQDLQAGKYFPSSILSEICETFSCIISIEIAANSLSELLKVINPTGLSFKGGQEEKIGFKSFEELDEMFEEIEIFD
ncbi:MAG: N-(5'-phosphoribosyl)anthranilate isomerase [Bacteroidota bacterium]